MEIIERTETEIYLLSGRTSNLVRALKHEGFIVEQYPAWFSIVSPRTKDGRTFTYGCISLPKNCYDQKKLEVYVQDFDSSNRINGSLAAEDKAKRLKLRRFARAYSGK